MIRLDQLPIKLVTTAGSIDTKPHSRNTTANTQILIQLEEPLESCGHFFQLVLNMNYLFFIIIIIIGYWKVGLFLSN